MDRADVSVAEALGLAHAALLDDLNKLAGAACPASGEGLEELGRRLRATQAHVAEHFRLEEENGYLGDVRRREPRLERDVTHLAEEHRALKQSLEALALEAEAIARRERELREQVRAWAKSLRRHEARENRLVQDAYNMDLGAED